MKPAPLTQQPEWYHLPRLDPEFYRGFAAVLWIITLQHRSTGWLDDHFHLHFRELLLHAAAREGLFCPAYVLMPDHAHLVWLGLRVESDQRNAMKFLRKHLAAELARRSPTGVEFELQKQSHDSVLREKDRVRGAFQKTCFYVLDNPRRKQLATQRPRDIPDGVLSQMGTLIVHRLINDKDREVVERAAGEIDRAAAAFLPTLSPGEAAVVGVDFPIPLTVQIAMPPEIHKPKSEGPNFQKAWTAERIVPVVSPPASKPTPVVKEPDTIAGEDDIPF